MKEPGSLKCEGMQAPAGVDDHGTAGRTEQAVREVIFVSRASFATSFVARFAVTTGLRMHRAA